MERTECPHGFPLDRVTAQGLPLCPTCRRAVVRTQRHGWRGGAYDAAKAAANDYEENNDDD